MHIKPLLFAAVLSTTLPSAAQQAPQLRADNIDVEIDRCLVVSHRDHNLVLVSLP